MKQLSFSAGNWGFVLLAACLTSLGTPAYGFPSFHPTNCSTSGCHGARPLQSTPANGGTITFGTSEGNTLVGQTSSATWTLKNNHTNSGVGAATRGGGFTGSFPGVAAGSEFGPNSALAINGTFSAAGAPEYLIPQQSDSRDYTYTPLQRSLGVFDTTTLTFTPTNGGSTPSSVSITLRGMGVAPQASLNTSQANAGNVLVGMTGTARLTMDNVGDGGLAAASLGTLRNLNGSFAAVAGLFSSGPSAFSIGDNLSQEKQYSFAPLGRGTFTQNVNVSATNGSSNGLNQAQSFTPQLSGKGVAPLVALGTTQTNAGNVRIGTTGTAVVTVQNTGDGNTSGAGPDSNLKGGIALTTGSTDFSGSGAPIDLGDGASQMQSFSYAPGDRGTDARTVQVDTTNGNSDGTNLPQTLIATLSGTGVGPTFASSVAVNSTIDFGTVSLFTPGTMPVSLSNDTLDPELGDLTALTLKSFSITGEDASLFSVTNFVAGTKLAKGASLALDIGFLGSAAKDTYTASLSFLTDEGAALGGNGNAFGYSLQAVAVPEPKAWLMLAAGLGCMGVLVLRRRRALCGRSS